MQASTKEIIAIGICLTSAVGAIAAVRMGWKLTDVIMDLTLVWSCTGTWVSRLPRFWQKNFRELLAIARRGGLREGRVSSMISLGGMLLFVMFFVALYETR
jgi:hypothetical protein